LTPPPRFSSRRRQELIYGASALIGPTTGSTSAELSRRPKSPSQTQNNILDVFVVRPIDIHKQSLNGEDESTIFAGIYNVTALPNLLAGRTPNSISMSSPR